MKDSLLELLKKHTQTQIPMHMPGHKRNMANLPKELPWQIDVTEVLPFDNLQNPQGILKESAKLAADLWQSKQAFFSVGGSTAGILAGIYGLAGRGEQVLISRNAHASVYHAIEISGLAPVYLEPKLTEYGFYGSVSAKEVSACIEKFPDIKLAVITSPTYEGVLSDISAISEILHEKNIPLFVDAAHGAHLDLPFAAVCGFPKGALLQGADLVIHSLHKTLPALTQTAILHVNSDRIDRSKIAHAMSLFQSSSPSYPLIASIDFCCRFLQESGKEYMSEYQKELQKFQQKAKNLKNIKLITKAQLKSVFDFDMGKLLMYTGAAKGSTVVDKLRKSYNIEVEMEQRDFFLAMTSLLDSSENYENLAKVLREIDTEMRLLEEAQDIRIRQKTPCAGEQKMLLEDALKSKNTKLMPLEKAEKHISAEYVWCYPPGVPLLVPGMEITREFISWAAEIGENHTLHSTWGEMPKAVMVAETNDSKTLL
jgi:Arginine/lysine/ornithine decarboxylases